MCVLVSNFQWNVVDKRDHYKNTFFSQTYIRMIMYRSLCQTSAAFYVKKKTSMKFLITHYFKAILLLLLPALSFSFYLSLSLQFAWITLQPLQTLVKVLLPVYITDLSLLTRNVIMLHKHIWSYANTTNSSLLKYQSLLITYLVP